MLGNSLWRLDTSGWWQPHTEIPVPIIPNSSLPGNTRHFLFLYRGIALNTVQIFKPHLSATLKYTHQTQNLVFFHLIKSSPVAGIGSSNRIAVSMLSVIHTRCIWSLSMGKAGVQGSNQVFWPLFTGTVIVISLTHKRQEFTMQKYNNKPLLNMHFAKGFIGLSQLIQTITARQVSKQTATFNTEVRQQVSAVTLHRFTSAQDLHFIPWNQPQRLSCCFIHKPHTLYLQVCVCVGGH